MIIYTKNLILQILVKTTIVIKLKLVNKVIYTLKFLKKLKN